MEQKQPSKLPAFHPATRDRSLCEGEPDFTVADAVCNPSVFRMTGSGKTSATARRAALGYLGCSALGTPKSSGDEPDNPGLETTLKLHEQIIALMKAATPEEG